MEFAEVASFLVGAGGATSVVGAILVRKINKNLDNLALIPALITRVDDLEKTVNKFDGKLDALKDNIHQNNKEIAVVETKVQAAFRQVDSINRNMKL